MVRGSVLRSRVLSLAKACSIGLRSGEIARQEEQLGAGGADQAAHGLALVTAPSVARAAAGSGGASWWASATA
jgi:hypothetical protein